LFHGGGKITNQTNQCNLSGQIKQQRDLLKMALRVGLIKSNCPVEDVLTPLSCCKVSAGNGYEVCTRKMQNDPNI
jgi:hypothetical protein